jgi:hypothetical protein
MFACTLLFELCGLTDTVFDHLCMCKGSILSLVDYRCTSVAYMHVLECEKNLEEILV